MNLSSSNINRQDINKIKVLIVLIFSLFLYVITARSDIMIKCLSVTLSWILSNILILLNWYGFSIGSFEWFFDITYIQHVLIIFSCCLIMLCSFHFFAHITFNNLGFRLSSGKRSAYFWVFSIGVFYGAIFILYIAILNIANSFGYSLGFSPGTISNVQLDDLFNKLIFSPLIEEIVFRGILLSALAVFFGWKPIIIIIGGLLFAVSHFFYGNPDPMNFVGGYFLAWVFYNTRSLLLPIFFHFLGNLFCLLIAYINTYHPNSVENIIAMFIISK